MNIFLENVAIGSTSGPNHFAAKLMHNIKKKGHFCSTTPHPWPDVQLSFIQAKGICEAVPLVQRLDGIYFDIGRDYKKENSATWETYKKASGIIFQSNYSKNLIFKYFGECENYTIINNGADIEYVKSVKPLKDRKLDRYENIWTCASHWRGWKRMPDNIRYFLEFSGEKDCLLVAGMPLQGEVIEHERIFYTGHLSPPTLFSIFKISKNFIHLARYDACPNVVVDARAAGCHIICSSEGGTKEVAGEGATVVVEEPWDMNPIDVDNPPKLEFKNIIKNDIISDIDMTNVADKYINYLKTFMEKKK